MKVIELKDVKKSYGKNEILHGISLDIEEGSIHGLVGRNGCGKTTLIKCLTGIYEQDQGQILVCGEEIFENPNVKAPVLLYTSPSPRDQRGSRMPSSA